MLTRDIWEPVRRYCDIHCWHMVVIPCGPWLASSSLHSSRVVSEASFSIGVDFLLVSAAPLFKGDWAWAKAVLARECLW